MPAPRVFMCVTLLLPRFVSLAAAQSSPAPAPQTTLHVNTRLVFLDTTVVDKQEHIVTSGLSKDDFLITEDTQPRRIFSFEEHAAAMGKDAPATIFVADQINGSFQDFAFLRYSLRRYFASQPPELSAPCELLLLGQHGLQMVQSFTRSKARLLAALDGIPPLLSRIFTDPSVRFNESMYALQLIALQNQGVSGLKNVLWIGYGAPTTNPLVYPGGFEKIVRVTHETTNLLLDARVSLYLIYPGIPTFGGGASLSAMEAEKTAMTFSLGNGPSPLNGEIHFSAFADATGGALFYRNNVDSKIDRSRALGANYYTLTYQPQQSSVDGRFRNIRVTMRNPELHAVTKTGYFAPTPEESANPARQVMDNLVVAVHSMVPLYGLKIGTEKLRWRPDTGTAELTLQLEQQSLRWHVQPDGTRTASVLFAVANWNGSDRMLASTYQQVDLTKPTHLSGSQEDTVKQSVVFHVAPKTTNVRFVVETVDGDKLGSGEISRKELDAAPRTATPEPVLIRRPLP